jgi:hypothetical protein
MRKLLSLAFAIGLFASPASADQLNPPPGGSSTLTSNSTATSGFSAGQLLYSDGAHLQALGQGSTGQFLQSNGAGAAPTWGSPSGSGTVNSGAQYCLSYYAASGTALSCAPYLNINGATLAVGANGSPGGALIWGNLAGQSSTIVASTYSGQQTFTLPYAASDVLLSANSTATLTNKTFSGSTNVWQGGVIGAAYGGTGVNNGSNTATLGGNLSTGGAVTFSGAYSFTGTLTAATSVTFPTSGTLLANPITTAGDLIYGGASGAATRLAIGSNGNCLTVSGGNPAWGSCGSASPGGSSGQVQLNSSGSFGGSANLTWSSPTLTIGQQLSSAGVQGALVLANTATNTGYAVTLQSSNSATAGYTLTLPPAPASGAQCLQTAASGGVLSFGSCGGTSSITVGSTPTSGGQTGGLLLDSGSVLTETTGLTYASNVFQIQNSTSPQYLNVYGTTGTNAEYTQIGYGSASGPFTINTNKSGAGTTNFQIQTAGTTLIDYGVSNSGYLTVGNTSSGKVVLANELYVAGGPVWFAGTSGGIFFTTNTVANNSQSVDTSYCRVSAGVVEFGGSSCGKTAAVQAASFQASGGTAPTLTTGSCSGSSWSGGATAGKFTTSSACTSGQTLILSGLPASAVGYACEAHDTTTTADPIVQTAYSTTSATLTATSGTATSDTIVVSCIGF